MPKVVDHAERREEILDATRRVILKQGLGGVTMRSIASEVGKSTGHVNHYFEDKGHLLVAALESSMARFDRGLRDQSSGKAPGRATLRALLLAALPENDEERVHWILWFGAGRNVPWGSQDDTVRAIQRAPFRDWHRLILDNFEIAVEGGEFQAKLDIRSEVDRLVAIVVGLGVESAFLGVSKTRSELKRLIDDQVARLEA